MSSPVPEKPGLQAERTLLSWERSALGFLVGGALLLMKETGPFQVGRTALAVVAGSLTLLVLWLAYRRSRRIRAMRVVEGRSVAPEATLEVYLIACATALFALGIVGVLLIGL